MTKRAAICALLVLAMAQLMVEPANAIDCITVDMKLYPCVPYLTGQAAEPATECCSGIDSIKRMATTTPERQAACNCMKAAASHLQGIKDSAVQDLPNKCNVPLPYPISVNVDCSNIH